MIGANQIIEKKKEFLLPSSHRNHFYANAPQIVKGSMQFLYDDQGKEFNQLREKTNRITG